MSRGGGRGGKSGVNVLANALNIQRNELNSGPLVIQAPPLFPIIDVQPLPSASNNDLNYMVESKQEFLRRMRESPYYLREKAPKYDVERYSDKYKKRLTEPWNPHWKRMPKLLWPRNMADPSSTARPSSKKPKLDGKNNSKIDSKLEALEEIEKRGKPDVEAGDLPKTPKKDKEEEENAEKNEEELEMSDEDYLEEDNDYVHSYFDNGDEYLDESDDNNDGEAVY